MNGKDSLTDIVISVNHRLKPMLDNNALPVTDVNFAFRGMQILIRYC
jgi:hypothetical protein